MNRFKIQKLKSGLSKRFVLSGLLVAFCLLAFGCRYDMQDQPRYKSYKESDFFKDGKAMRDLPAGTVARGQLQLNKALYTGKKADADPNAKVESTTTATGTSLITTFPTQVDEFPIPVTKDLVDRGQNRYNIYCGVCHGPTGKGDGMVVRRGYPQPPTYHDDRLRNAPVGHFFDVMTNGLGKMNSYSDKISVTDRWAIVAYIRALQVSQNPDGTKSSEDTENKEDKENTDSNEKASEDKKADDESKKDEAPKDESKSGGGK